MAKQRQGSIPETPPSGAGWRGARLVRLKGGVIHGAYRITSEPLTLGRDRANRIVVADDRASKHHAVISLRNGTVVVEDLQSLNGTRVNEHKVRSRVLKPGDVVRIGWTLFLFMVSDMPLSRHPAGPVGWVIGRRPGGGGIKIPVAGGPILLGGAPEADVCVQEPGVADYHALIAVGPTGVQWIELTPEPPRCTDLTDGLDVHIGSLTLKYRAEARAADAPNAPAPEPPARRRRRDRPPADVPPEPPAPPRPTTPPPPAGGPKTLADTAPLSPNRPLHAAPSSPDRDTGLPLADLQKQASDGSILRYLQEEADRLDREAPPSTSHALTPPTTVPLEGSGPSGSMITATRGPRAGQTFTVSDRRVSIGRDTRCSLALDDPAVSPRHAVIYRQEGDLVVEDLNSETGVFHNGQRIHKRPLRPGDVLRIGASEFLVHL